MTEQKAYAHGWYSHPGQSLSTQEKRPQHTSNAALAQYLPREAYPPPKSLVKGDFDIQYAQQETREHTPPPALLKAEPVELGDNAECYNLEREHPYAGSTRSHTSIRLPVHQRPQLQDSKNRPLKAREAQLMHPAQQHESFVETLYLSESNEETPLLGRLRQETGQVVYPNMVSTLFDNNPRYSAPAWMSQTALRSARAHTFQEVFYPTHSSTLLGPHVGGPSSSMQLPTTFQPSFARNDLSHGQEMPPPFARAPWVPSIEHPQIPNLPPPILPKPSAIQIYELDAQDISPLMPTQTKPMPTTAWQPSSTWSPFVQQPNAPQPGASFFQNTYASVPLWQHRSSSEGRSPFSSHMQSFDDVAGVASDDKIQADQQSFSLPHPDIVKLTEPSPVEAVGFTESRVSGQYTDLKAIDYDNFYTPANEKFYGTQPYDRLNHRLKEIRLLRVFPKKPSWQHYEARPNWDASHAGTLDRNQCLIACEIEKASLTRIGDNYATLSYCAGDPNKTAVVLVDGVPFNAFANLEHAIDRLLAHWSSLHHDGESLLLWADQISINQSDKDERSQQVRIMRDIYRQSAETYVCMSVPKAVDCLSWVPRTPVERLSGKGDHNAVVKLKNLLLDFLVGEGNGRELRPIEYASTSTGGTAANDDGRTDQALYPHGASSVALLRQSSIRNMSDRISNRSSAMGVRPPGRVLSLSRGSSFGFKNNVENLQISAAEFQPSLAEFMTNKWWRRSWVYQEFLSATSLHFISGPTTVSWSELSPLVEFICESLDQFMEDIRNHFESQITEEMRLKEREEREVERSLLKEEQRRQWQKWQRKTREEDKRRRKEQEERRQQQLEVERERRKIEARKEAQRLYEESLERYSQEQRNFEAERLNQWRTALEVQLHQRAEFDAQQKLQVRQELMRLSQQKASVNKVMHPFKIMELRRKISELRHFEHEVMKPIDEQVASAVRLFTMRSDPKTNEQMDRQCGLRLHDKHRIDALLSMNLVPVAPEKFVSDTLKPPARPAATFSSSSLNLETGQYRGMPQDRYGHGLSEVRSKSPIAGLYTSQPKLRRTRNRSTTVSSNSDDAETIEVAEELEVLDDETIASDNELPPEHGEVSFERLGTRVIEQKDRITRLQDDFRRLDKTALASMAKGKKEFKRDAELITLLQHSRNCAASDPRDRIYAFIGLADPGYRIIPNYGSLNKLESVLVETAKSIIQHDQSLVILQHVHRGRAKLGVRLPSWVPDWTSKETSYGVDQYKWNSTTPFDAGKGSRAIAEFYRRAEDGFYEDLRARGVFVGRVESIEADSELEHVSSLILSEGEWVFGPKAARFDDEVWVLYGATRPAVLRPEGEDRFGYLGDALVCEDAANAEQTLFSPIMYGQMIERVREGTALVKDIWII